MAELPTSRKHGSHGAPDYPKLASTIAKGLDYSIFRRFDELSARNLLRAQDELMALEEEFRSLDNAESRNQHSMHATEKESLFSRLEFLLKRYHKALYLQNQIHELGTPTHDMAQRFDFWYRNAAMMEHADNTKRHASWPSHHILSDGTERLRDYANPRRARKPESRVERLIVRCVGWWIKEELPYSTPFEGPGHFKMRWIERIKHIIVLLLAVGSILVPTVALSYFCARFARWAVMLISMSAD
ncbi:hypothetical protein FKW77_005790 [Venturia effusa]|uniref:DUF6594 domain-containing protein n=1 Tax=Venturia effusa TaxID=50376 RepID=A0A517LQ95_9PEZI|nr:hypothetical protein FKW77_005790 [Venturia effusa]